MILTLVGISYELPTKRPVMPAASRRICWSGLLRPQIPFDRVEFQQGDVLTVESPCEAFDAVSTANVFYHIGESTNRSLV